MKTVPCTIMPSDVEKVCALVESRRSDWFVTDRQHWNVDGTALPFDREMFWHHLLGCLLTTQQRSTKGSPVNRFLDLEPFPLSFSACTADIEKTVIDVLTGFGGIRFAPKIARFAKANYAFLDSGGWTRVQEHYARLSLQRNRAPKIEDKPTEREAAYFVDDRLAGIGPKQSRNLWQWLGLTRFEIPLDGRICKWINVNLSIKVNIADLGEYRYYDAVLDCIQAVCHRAGVLPCIFDAAAFDFEEKGTSTEAVMPAEPKRTTETGYVNPNGQVVIRDTGLPGSDHLQRVYQVACSKCGHVYGANGSDCHLRKCPECQGGAAGLSLARGANV